MFSHSCNGTNIFIWWKMKCTIQLGLASLNRTFHPLPRENICTITFINIHYLCNISQEIGGIVKFLLSALVIPLLYYILHYTLRLLCAEYASHYLYTHKASACVWHWPQGATQMARGGIRLVHGHTNSTLITYFSGMKIDPKYAFLHAFFLICLSCPFQSLSIWPKTHPFFQYCTFCTPKRCSRVQCLVLKNNPN